MSEVSTAATIPTELTQEEKAYAGLAHALMISTWWIGPLVIFLMKRSSRFVSFHSAQALIWQVVFTLIYILGMAVFFAVVLSSVLSAPQGKPPEPGQFPIALFVVFPLFWLIMMGGVAISMTLGIVYCIKAMKGEWAGYPLIGRIAYKILGA
jgi:uncharacterized membrane protein